MATSVANPRIAVIDGSSGALTPHFLGQVPLVSQWPRIESSIDTRLPAVGFHIAPKKIFTLKLGAPLTRINPVMSENDCAIELR